MIMASGLKEEIKAEIDRLTQEIKTTKEAKDRKELAKELREATRKLLESIEE